MIINRVTVERERGGEGWTQEDIVEKYCKSFNGRGFCRVSEHFLECLRWRISVFELTVRMIKKIHTVDQMMYRRRHGFCYKRGKKNYMKFYEEAIENCVIVQRMREKESVCVCACACEIEREKG